MVNVFKVIFMCLLSLLLFFKKKIKIKEYNLTFSFALFLQMDFLTTPHSSMPFKSKKLKVQSATQGLS